VDVAFAAAQIGSIWSPSEAARQCSLTTQRLLITGQAEPSLRDLPLHSRPATTTPPSMTSPGKPGSPPDGTLTTEHDTAITNLDSSIT
jgi:hypothetical protein